MAQGIRACGLQHGTVVAVDDNGGEWRRIVFAAGVAVMTAPGMGVMRMAAIVVPPRVSYVAGYGKRRGNGGTRQQAITKPRSGPEIHRCHQ
jgi:hypothetical protein